MNGLPYHVSELSPRRLAAFKNFLNAAGAEIFSSSNAYELLRFRAGDGMAHIYRDKLGVLKFVGTVSQPWLAFVRQKRYRAVKMPARLRVDMRSTLLRACLERDGRGCFYCGRDLPPGDRQETLEHLLSRAAGGSNHVDNCARAHGRCNERASHLSLPEKIRLRERQIAKARKKRRR